MNKKSLLIYAISIVMVLSVAVWAYNYMSDDYIPEDLPDTAQSQSLETAPDFTVEDAEGNSVKLSDYRGKPVVVNFWASWCKPCQMEFPAFEKLYKENGKDIHFLMVNMTDNQRETKEIAEGYIKGAGYTFPVFFDTNMDAAYTYYVSSIPMTLFIDAEGNIVHVQRGTMSEDMLGRFVSALKR